MKLNVNIMNNKEVQILKLFRKKFEQLVKLSEEWEEINKKTEPILASLANFTSQYNICISNTSLKGSTSNNSLELKGKMSPKYILFIQNDMSALECNL